MYLRAEFSKLANIHLVPPPCSPDVRGTQKRYHQEFLKVLHHLAHLTTKPLIIFLKKKKLEDSPNHLFLLCVAVTGLKEGKRLSGRKSSSSVMKKQFYLQLKLCRASLLQLKAERQMPESLNQLSREHMHCYGLFQALLSLACSV